MFLSQISRRVSLASSLVGEPPEKIWEDEFPLLELRLRFYSRADSPSLLLKSETVSCGWKSRGFAAARKPVSHHNATFLQFLFLFNLKNLTLLIEHHMTATSHTYTGTHLFINKLLNWNYKINELNDLTKH